MIETGEFERLGLSRTRRVDTRIITATNADLNEEVAAGRFRQDLLFRLNTIEIRRPLSAIAARICRCSPSTSCASTRSATGNA